MSWSPVREDICGNIIDVVHYVVYMSPDAPFFLPVPGDSIGVGYPPETTFEDTNALLGSKRFYNVKAVIEHR